MDSAIFFVPEPCLQRSEPPSERMTATATSKRPMHLANQNGSLGSYFNIAANIVLSDMADCASLRLKDTRHQRKRTKWNRE